MENTLRPYDTLVHVLSQDWNVQGPGHAMHYMVFGYEEFVRRVLQLTGLAEQEDRREYESWDPYRLQDPQADQP